MSDRSAKEPKWESVSVISNFNQFEWTAGRRRREPSFTKESMLLWREPTSESIPNPVLNLTKIAIYGCSAFTGREIRLEGKYLPTKLRKVVHEAAESYCKKPSFGGPTSGTHLTTPLEEDYHSRYAPFYNLVHEMPLKLQKTQYYGCSVACCCP